MLPESVHSTNRSAFARSASWDARTVNLLSNHTASAARICTLQNQTGYHAGVDAILAVKRFSQLGGLQLDRDIRALVAYAGELTQRPVRDKFAELTQVGACLILLANAAGLPV